ncbi:MAG TPA: nitrite/sulfite reductase [Geminicoccaceae bacterium]|nr:nitrite/sulfite reductase [Geminicoccaceae bacterium]
MYRYDEFDHRFVQERTAQFEDQVERRLRGDLTEDEFRPLRLMNGLYLQLHAYMLRVAIPYGTLSARQMRKLADIAEVYDRGYGHFTTRQNVQYNWPKLEDVPAILAALASVEMHAIQTSGNCIRNVTTDQWAGVAADEVMDPRPWCELLRQWSSLHPEFSYLPRKFKIAVTGAPFDRAAVKVHDIGLRMHRNDAGEAGFEVIVGGGQGRTPMIGKTIRAYLPVGELLAYTTSIMRVYNRFGRRDNKFKARIKILLHEIGADEFARLVEEDYAAGDHGDGIQLAEAEVERIQAYFAPPPYERLPERDPVHDQRVFENEAFRRWVRANVAKHKVPGYAIANNSLKPIGGIPGDASAAQMRAVADLADEYGMGEIRVTHEQNLVLPHVRTRDLFAVWQGLVEADLATPNIGLLSDIIACPGMDYCALATARSIPIAQAIGRRFEALDRQHEVGPLKIKISGCINACGHHHVGHIGILGLEKQGLEFYQITLGGSADETASIGRILGPGFAGDDVVDAVESIVGTYLRVRVPGEDFLAAYRRVGPQPFKEALYAADQG